jgi:uncharacterized protein YggT (Ycf19 family)
MSLFNFLLNLFGVALWINWLSSRADPLTRPAGISLAGTLKRTRSSPGRRWPSLAFLVTLLVVRAWFWVQLSPITTWRPGLKLGVIILSFRSDYPSHMLVYSFLSFGSVLSAFYLWLLLLAFGPDHPVEENPIRKLIRFHLGRLERLPVSLQMLLPLITGAGAWLALHPLLARLAIVPAARSATQPLAQSAVIGLETYFTWEYLIIGVLLLYLLHCYVHLGNHPVWEFLDSRARAWLRPFRWLPLRAGRVDFLPLALVIVLVLLAILVDHPPGKIREWFYQVLPF